MNAAGMTPGNMTLVLGNKTYSSWSLRAWLAARLTGADFQEVVIALYEPEAKAEILRHSPAGKVPILKDGAITVSDSLAIGEYLAERFPEAGLWPTDPAARAEARSRVAEMHSGFARLRERMPMDLVGDYAAFERHKELPEEIGRIAAIWTDCRQRFGQGGAFLFGAPGLADAFYAPLAFRFRGFAVPLEGLAADYCATLLDWPLMREWESAARTEPWRIEWPALTK